MNKRVLKQHQSLSGSENVYRLQTNSYHYARFKKRGKQK